MNCVTRVVTKLKLPKLTTPNALGTIAIENRLMNPPIMLVDSLYMYLFFKLSLFIPNMELGYYKCDTLLKQSESYFIKGNLKICE
jgi:hypothetical protein